MLHSIDRSFTLGLFNLKNKFAVENCLSLFLKKIYSANFFNQLVIVDHSALGQGLTSFNILTLFSLASSSLFLFVLKVFHKNKY